MNELVIYAIEGKYPNGSWDIEDHYIDKDLAYEDRKYLEERYPQKIFRVREYRPAENNNETL